MDDDDDIDEIDEIDINVYDEQIIEIIINQ